MTTERQPVRETSSSTASSTTLCLATDDGPIVVHRRGRRWIAAVSAEVRAASCIAASPDRPERLLCGTWRDGVWRSDDAGRAWSRASEGIPHPQVTSLAISPHERVAGRPVAYAGTEPSALFRSEDGGSSWQPCPGLLDLPSSSEWSFPPRPATHHARWIEPDPHRPGRLYVAIEAGALVQTPDGGRTWADRAPGGPYDTHQLATHRSAPGKLWSAAGDGFFESDDYGASWRKAEDGLEFRYCWSVALDQADPETAVLSASPGPREAHTTDRAESAIYLRRGSGRWRAVTAGLPPGRGTRAPLLASDPTEPGTFFAAVEADLYRSSDGGVTWQRLEVEWPEGISGWRAHGFTVAPASARGPRRSPYSSGGKPTRSRRPGRLSWPGRTAGRS